MTHPLTKFAIGLFTIVATAISIGVWFGFAAIGYRLTLSAVGL